MHPLYTHLVDWYPLLDPVEHHAEEAELFTALLRGSMTGPPDRPALLELGAGAGNNAAWLQQGFDCTLVDLSPDMRRLAAARLPDRPVLDGDMRTVRLGRTFDAVLLHDAVAYMCTEDDLRAALATVYAHLRPGGAAVVAPDHHAEDFAPGTEPLEADAGTRSLRGLAWGWDPDPADTTVRTDYALLLRDGDALTAVHHTDVEGLFPRATWRRLLEEVGFRVRPAERRLTDVEACDVWVAQR